MKNIITIYAALLISAILYLPQQASAQTPDKMSYQAVVRDLNNNLITNQVVSMKVSILQGSINGTAVYEEIYNPNPSTNANGLVTVEIGSGVPLLGNFTVIDWSAGPYFIKSETDPTGGTSFSIIGTSQLLSVPYALHAKTAQTVIGGITETDPVFVASPANGIVAGDITNWITAHTHSTTNTGSVHGSTAVGGNLLRLANPSAISFLRINADNSVSTLNAPDFRTAIGVGTGNGTVTSIATGNGIAGGTITSTGTLGLTGQALAFHILNTNGIIARSSIGSITTRTLTAGTGITITNGNGVNGNPIIAARTYAIGDFAHGGIVFWVDATGQHGLVCAKTDQSTAMQWYAGTNTPTMAKGDGPYAGNMNTVLIIASQGLGNGTTYAARVCNELQITEGGKTYGDWYLPSRAELSLMYLNSVAINATATANGGTALSSTGHYWCSTESDPYAAWGIYFGTGVVTDAGKGTTDRVRAVRAF